MAYGTRRFNAAFTRALPCFYSVRLLASRQTPKLEDHSWSAVHDCLFNIFFNTFNMYKERQIKFFSPYF